MDLRSALVGREAERETLSAAADILERVVRRPAASAVTGGIELPDRNAGEPAQCAGQAQLVEHAVVAVRRLAGVLEEKDRAVQVGELAARHARFDHGEVAAEQSFQLGLR